MNCHSMDTENISEHSSVGPSSIADIILCPGRVRLSKGIEDITSFAAAQGTVAHAISEKKLNGGNFPKIGTIITEAGHDIEFDKEMLESIKLYIKHIDSIRQSVKSPLIYSEAIETKNSLDFLGIPEVFGTADYSLSVPFYTLYIRDLKYGSGIMVNPENNPQLMCYALIAGQKLFDTFQTINLGIVQPRSRDGATIKTWETTPNEILDWARKTLHPIVKIALSDEASLNPGEKQCRWCKAQGICPELAKQALQVAQKDFKDYADIRPDEVVESVSIEKVAQVYKQLPLLKKFIKAVEERVFNTLALGEKVNGYKLVKGRKSRAWQDELTTVKALKKLGIDPYLLKVVSPAQAEKQLDKAGKKEVQSLICVSEGKPSIVKESDKREAITTAADDFAAFKN